MTLEFPNRCRSFDEGRNAVRFLGYDGTFEVPFFVEVSALSKSGEALDGSEATFLAAFDASRGSIHDVARKTYLLSRRRFYTLTAADFR
ncbi:DUF1488 domain-containing protein [Arvimicrobium flavum]|uniref:DUF1488 domain-containing protein n=1 Tax=Arvimicrobium flavum TaxID=3393320 RepID=UPI00237A93D9|nr:DUF1488 domain-containing protein [Mesorhizobium shangrilense]